MRKLRSLLKRVRLVYRRSSTLTKTVVMSAIALSMAALLTLQIAYNAQMKRYEENRQQAAQLEQENDKLEENNNAMGSADSVEQIAKDELNMVPTDAVVIVPGE